MCLEERLDAVERALTDGEDRPATVTDAAPRGERLDDAETRLDDLEERVAELEAATQALRGYVGNARSVNREVEETAAAAHATAERLERRLDAETTATQRESVVPAHVERRSHRPSEAVGGTDDPTERLAEWVRNAL